MKFWNSRVISSLVLIAFFFSNTNFASAAVSSVSPRAVDVTIENNVGKNDTVTVEGLNPYDLVKVYTSSSSEKLLGSGTVQSGKTSVTISISQIGTEAGSVNISVTSKGCNESDKTKVDFLAEDKSDSVSSDNVTIVNNVGKSDTINVAGLSTGDIVKVYAASTGTRSWGTATSVGYVGQVTIYVSQLGTSSGSVYISVTSRYMRESDRTKVDYLAEEKSDSISAENVTITNNANISDNINVTGVTAGDIIQSSL